MENKQKIIKFEELKPQIIAALKNLPQGTQISEPVTLIEGFLNQPFSPELSSSFVIGGSTIPMIMLIGSNTGKIYLFALKAIVPNIGL